jgi:tight adherence protein C
MNEFWIIGCFFVCVMGILSFAGYWFMTSGNRQSEASPDATSVLLDAVVKVGGGVEVKDTKGIKKKLMFAGYRKASAVPVFNAIKYATMVLFAVILGFSGGYKNGSMNSSLIPAMCGAGLGFIVVNRMLDGKVKSRSEKLRFGLPPALDMIVLSLEAGQSLDSSIIETSREMREAYPELSYEMNLVQLELLASKSRIETFRNLAERNAEPEMKRLSQVLIDSDRFGTPLAPALRSHTNYLRLRLRQTAREAARKVGVKLVFPVFFLIFPSVLLVTLGPAVLMIYYQLTPLLTGNP